MNSILNRRTVRGWELRQGVESFAHQVAEHLGLRGITIRWTAIETAAINGSGVMYLSSVKDDAVINRATLVRYVGFVLHELLHRKYSNFDVNGTGYLHKLHNAIEDAWIERRAIREGLTGNIQGVLTDLLGQIVGESLDSVRDWSDPSVYPFALAVYARQYGVTVPLAQGLEPIFAEATRRVDACVNSKDTLKVAKWVYDQLSKLPESQPQPQPQPQDGQKQDQKQAQGEGQGEAQGDAQGKAQGEGKGEGEGEQTGQARSPAPNQRAIEVEPNLGNRDPGSAGTYWVGRDSITTPGAHLTANPVRDMKALPVPGKLRHEVRRLFDNSGMTLFTRNRKAGSINIHALPRAGVTDRVFQQRRDIEGVDSAVVICLDVSGSMRRHMDTVTATGALLTDTLIGAQVSTAIVSFGSRASLVAPFGTNAVKARNLLSRLTLGGDTNDYAAVRLAADMLLPRSEERKVIFVVTDGEGGPHACREQCRAAQALGITVIGVGIGVDVSHIYPNTVRINSVADLGNTVFNQVKLAA